MEVVAVVTAPDKPAGRGQQMQSSPVKVYASSCGIPVLQPVKLKDPAFLEELATYKADLQIIVAFRMLPEAVWSMPPMGTFNLHASLLPQYRGAAPIHWAVINGETETGITTFFLQHEIDTGDLLFQEKEAISHEDVRGRTELLGDFHVRMAELMGNQVLADILGDLISRCSLITLMYQSTLAAEHSTDEHVEIVNALAKRDEALAVRLMDEHLQHVEATLTFDRKIPSHDISHALS